MKNPFESFFHKAAELSAAELEKPNFEAAVIQALQRIDQPEMADMIIAKIQSGEINLEPDAQKMVEMGKLAEKAAEQEEKEFDSTEHLNRRAEMTAGELIEKFKEKK